MKKKLIGFGLILSLFLAACNGREAELETKIAVLEKEIELKEAQLEKSLTAYELVNDSLTIMQDSVRFYAENGSPEAAAKMENLMSRIRELANENKRLVSRMEASGTGTSNNRMVAILKKQLLEKDRQIADLEAETGLLKEEVIQKDRKINEQEGRLKESTEKLTEAEKQAETLRETAEKAEEKAKTTAENARREKGQALVKLAEQEEALAQKTSFLSRKKKKAHWQKARDYYEEAYRLGITDAQRKMFEMDEKLK